MSTLQLMAIKPTHINELWGMIVGYERPIHTHSLRPARESCEACHWPEARHNDTMRVKYRYADDAKSTESRTTLQLHTGTGAGLASGSMEIGRAGRTRAPSVAKGIHWHIAQDLEYVALDPDKQKIALIEVRDANGKVTATYFDPTAGISRADADKMPRRRIDCIDCHNAAGPSVQQSGEPRRRRARGGPHRPQPAVDQGALRRDHPEGRSDLGAGSGARGEVHGADRRRRAARRADPKAKEAEQKFAAEMKRILLLSSFAAKDLTWKTFPNNVGHKDFPGCFRCHDGKHMNDKGEAIRLQCTLCHALPKVASDKGVLTVAVHREPRPDARRRATKSPTGCTIIARTWTAAARCATGRSSGARTAAASAPIRPAMGASGRK